MVILKIAFRNIFRQKRRTVLTMLTMVGGFVLASVSIAWSDGTYNDVINTFTRNRLGHIQVHYGDYLDRPTLYKTIAAADQVGEAIGQVEAVDAWTPRIYSAGLASAEDETTAVHMIGIHTDREDRTTRFNDKIVDGQPFSPGDTNAVIVGKGLAQILDTSVGDDLVLLSQAADGSLANDRFTVRGIVDTGEAMKDRSDLYIPLATAQEFLVLQDRVHEIVVTVQTLGLVDPTVTVIEQRLSNDTLTVLSWKEFAKDFYVAMRADQRGMWITLFVILLIVAVGVLNTVLMAVLERRREYGVLKALGTRPGQIFGLVSWEIAAIALAAVAVGTIVALLSNHLLSFHGIRLPDPISYGGMEFQEMRTELNIRSFVIPAVTVLATAMASALCPAWMALRTRAAMAMRLH
ncbi:MAG: ABC transporter permease [Candidatus Pacebacteria bacterium]|nr:ABC transporter permease [Candidatus Paceibacterota bacterium]